MASDAHAKIEAERFVPEARKGIDHILEGLLSKLA
jgi:hypothetical protein